jgi:hypothetical protein
MYSRFSIAVLAAFAVGVGCNQPRSLPPLDPRPAEAGMPAPATPPGGGGDAAPRPSTPADPDPAQHCAFGTHLCLGNCVDDSAPATCGTSCEPCPAVKGGVAVCDGTRCAARCPPGQKPCGGECAPEAQSCAAGCAPGFHDCGGLCVDSGKVANCGTGCQSCPAAPPGGVATCDGTACGFSCEAGKRCGDRCGECCADADCTPRAGQTASCDLTTLRCKSACPPGTSDCNGQCIAAGACCKDGDCPPMNGKQGKCDASGHSCQYMCSADTRPCAGKCIAQSGCCDDQSCPGNFACTDNACSSSACKGGFKLCGGKCIPQAGCCEDSECGGNLACLGNVCSKTMCRGGFKSCNGQCIPSGGCCSDGECPGDHACKGNQCSPGECRAGYKSCNGQCIPSGGCCSDGDCPGNHACTGNQCSPDCRSGFKKCGSSCLESSSCCGNSECGTCSKCAGGRCVQESGEDVKNECPFGCTAGQCNACDPKERPTCDGSGNSSRCTGARRESVSCGGRGCVGGNCCGSGQIDCDGRCVAFQSTRCLRSATGGNGPSLRYCDLIKMTDQVFDCGTQKRKMCDQFGGANILAYSEYHFSGNNQASPSLRFFCCVTCQNGTEDQLNQVDRSCIDGMKVQSCRQ